jgi:hypothetical protein
MLPRALVLAGCLSVAACHGADGHGNARGAARSDLSEPQLQALPRIALAESDTLYVGRPAALAVDPQDGSLYLSDGFWGRVLHFSPAGALLGVYGRRGEGPGELKAPSAVSVHGGELLVSDVGKRELVRFDRATARFVGSARYDGIMRSLAPDGERVWAGVMNVPGKTALGWWRPGEAKVRELGPIPDEYVKSSPLAGIYTGIQVVSWADTVLAGFMGLNRLTLFRRDGTPLRTLAVPVRARKGEMANPVTALGKLDFPEQFSANSALFRMHRLPSGGFALVHYDQKIDGNLITAKVYLTLVSRDFRRTCADRAVVVSQESQPYTAFRGDTLYVMQQRIRDDRAAAFVDRYLIREDLCFG